MKQFSYIFLVFISFIPVLVSCSENLQNKTVYIEIPEHPWEKYSGQKLLYTVKWTDNNQIFSSNLHSNSEKIKLTIPRNQTVFICAFPLEDMEPFGIGITPFDSKKTYKLTQNDGILARIMMDLDPKIRQQINYNLLSEICSSVTDDYRSLNQSTLVQAILNGKLKKSAIKQAKSVEIPELSIPNGLWISQNTADNPIEITDGKLPNTNRYIGKYRFFCSELGKIYSITIEDNGNFSTHIQNCIL